MANTRRGATERALLLRFLDEAYNKQAWHGPQLRGTLRRVGAKQAVWRPKAGRHNIAEIVIHCAYWKYAVRRRILGQKRGSFQLKGSNWFVINGPIADSRWKELVAILDDEHRLLRNAIEDVPWEKLTIGPGGGASKPASHVHGAAMHDLYHAGQVQTLKAIQKTASRRG
jgi:DinB superfamily